MIFMFEKLDDDTIRTIKSLRKQGYSQPEIAYELGISLASVNKYCRGIPRGKHQSQLQPQRPIIRNQVQNPIKGQWLIPNTKPQQISDETRIAILECENKHMSLEQIMFELHVNDDTVGRVCREALWYLQHEDPMWWPAWLTACINPKTKRPY